MVLPYEEERDFWVFCDEHAQYVSPMLNLGLESPQGI